MPGFSDNVCWVYLGVKYSTAAFLLLQGSSRQVQDQVTQLGTVHAQTLLLRNAADWARQRCEKGAAVLLTVGLGRTDAWARRRGRPKVVHLVPRRHIQQVHRARAEALVEALQQLRGGEAEQRLQALRPAGPRSPRKPNADCHA